LEHVRLVGVVLWIASFVCLLAMNVTVRQSEQPTMVLLFYFGFLAVLAMADHGLYHQFEKWILRRQSRRSRQIPAQWPSCIASGLSRLVSPTAMP
jgi:hypothetical protein